MIKPFHLKAHLTYKELSEHLGLPPPQIESEDTIDLLNKLKRLFYTRAMLVAILKDIKERELLVSLLKTKIREMLTNDDVYNHTSSHENLKAILRNINGPNVEELQDKLNFIMDMDYKITAGIQNLYKDGLVFGTSTNRGKMLFKFSNREYVPHIDDETSGLNDLVQMLLIISSAH